ncbi:UNVERIFIED_CONTAM: hypothetical protein NCL1_03603 [Trichonephila clavipes]
MGICRPACYWRLRSAAPADQCAGGAARGAGPGGLCRPVQPLPQAPLRAPDADRQHLGRLSAGDRLLRRQPAVRPRRADSVRYLLPLADAALLRHRGLSPGRLPLGGHSHPAGEVGHPRHQGAVADLHAAVHGVRVAAVRGGLHRSHLPAGVPADLCVLGAYRAGRVLGGG